jgi:hypothetical protein
MNAIVKPEGGQPSNPFGSVVRAEPANAIAAAATQREVAEVQAMMTVARRFPRDAVQAMDRILNACARPTLAATALYSYARGGQEIAGPSIRLAEAMAQEWGNIQFGIRELEQRHGESTVEAYAHDLERNVRQSKVFQVRHERHTRKGVQYLSDPRDLYELVANQGARRLRACILGVIPGDVVEAAVEACDATMRADCDTGPETQRKLVEAFEAFGVSREQIEKRIQRRLDAIQPAQVVSLKKVYASLRDGMSAPGDWFDPIAQADEEAKPATLAEKVKASTRKQAEPKEPDPTPAAVEPKGPDVDPDTGEIIPDSLA